MDREFVQHSETTISDLKELEHFAYSFAPRLTSGISVGLSGDLGAGKTTLVRFLVAALGSGTPVSSPTYTLQHEYRVASGLVIEHWDLYRLAAAPEELLERCPQQHLRLIEWPEKTPEIMADLDLLITLSQVDRVNETNGRLLSVASRKVFAQ